MNTRISSGLIAIVLMAMAGLFVVRMLPYAATTPSQRYLDYNDVQGAEVIANGLPYTLNFEQQNHLISLINLSIPIDKTAAPTAEPLAITKIILYRFGSSPVELETDFYLGPDLVYTAHLWNSNGYMRDQSTGTLRDLLAKTYDP